jgi:DNA-binding NarL/FixJ family response regulator
MRASGDSELRHRIGVLLVDDCRSASDSLWALLNWQRDIHVIATAVSSAEALSLTKRRRPRVCMLSATLGPAGALSLAHRLKQLSDPPRVLLYADAVEPQLTDAAIVAGADGVLWRYADPAGLAEAIRHVVTGGQAFPAIGPDLVHPLADLVADRDRPIVAMVLLGTPPDEIARTLGISARSLRGRREAILRQLDDAVGATCQVAGHGRVVARRRRSHPAETARILAGTSAYCAANASRPQNPSPPQYSGTLPSS